MSVPVHRHSYKPTPEFFGTPLHKVFFGLELELDIEGYGRTSGVRALVLDGIATWLGKFAYCKEDSSIRGVELVTQPASLAVHRSRWKKFFPCDKRFVASSACGLHIHFSKTPEITGPKLWQIHSFINQRCPQTWLKTLAGRDFNDMASRVVKTEEEMGRFPEGKYEAVNTEPQSTVEIRIFASTTSYVELMLRLEFTASMVNYVLHMPELERLTLGRLRDFVGDRMKTYPHLNDYFGSHGIK